MNYLFKRRIALLLLGWAVTAGYPYAGELPSTTETAELAVQQQRIKGTVTDENNDPLPGATVMVKGTARGTTTDFDGHYEITATNGEVLVFSSIGFATQEKTVAGNYLTINVLLKEDTQQLSEVVVVGYGTQKKENLTGAVSQISEKELENRPAPGLTRNLQGMLPNLNIKMVSGNPTQSADFNVRGVTSIGTGGSALVLIDGVEGDPNLLNPNDVASVTVLKDAASSAIYGSRAAFGVVLITTKNPKKDRMSVDISSNLSFNSRTLRPKFVTDGQQWATDYIDAYSSWNEYTSYPSNIYTILPFNQEYYNQISTQATNSTIVGSDGLYRYFGNTDWLDLIEKRYMVSQENTISFSGGSDRVDYLISGRYYTQDGIFRHNSDEYNRYNLRAKGNIKVTDWFSIGNNTEYSRFTYDYPMMQNNSNIWYEMFRYGTPLGMPYNPDGSYTASAAYIGYAALKDGKNKSMQSENYLRNTSSVIIKPFLDDLLIFKADYTFAKTNRTTKRVTTFVDYMTGPNTAGRQGTSSLSQENFERDYWSTNIVAEFNKLLRNHTFKVLGGYNAESFALATLNFSRNNLIIDTQPSFALVNGDNISINGNNQDWTFAGYFYRVGYDYLGKYLLEINGRYDGSSKFPKNQRFGFFPSASVGWRISEENFMEGTRSWLSNLKLRASYGELGNGNVAPYLFQEMHTLRRSTVIINGNYQNYTSYPNIIPDGLTWEKSATVNFGVDMSLFDSRLGLEFDIYRRNTTDMFTAAPPIPNVFGGNQPQGNYADMKTNGWELTVSWKDQKEISGSPLRYGISASLWDSRSLITKYNNPNKIISTTAVTYYEGSEVGEIWGYETEGFFTSMADIQNHASQSTISTSNRNEYLPGDLKFKDLDGNGVINKGNSTADNPGDLKVIGNNMPRYQFGVNMNASYKGFGVSAFWQGIGKRDWYYDTQASMFWGPYSRPYSYQPTETMNNRWTETNPDGYFPRMRGYIALNTARTLAQPQTRYLQDASYLRLKTLTIDYSLPQSVLDKLGMTKTVVYLSGQNLLTFSGLFKYNKNIDPEAIESTAGTIFSGTGNGNTYPLMKTYTLGINLSF